MPATYHSGQDLDVTIDDRPIPATGVATLFGPDSTAVALARFMPVDDPPPLGGHLRVAIGGCEIFGCDVRRARLAGLVRIDDAVGEILVYTREHAPRAAEEVHRALVESLRADRLNGTLHGIDRAVGNAADRLVSVLSPPDRRTVALDRALNRIGTALIGVGVALAAGVLALAAHLFLG